MATSKVDIQVGVQGAEAAVEKIEKIGDAGEKATDKIRKGGPEASGALKAIDEAAHQAKDKMREMAGEAGPLGDILMKFGPAGLVAGAALGALTAVMFEGAQAADEATRNHLRLQASLNATGYAAGLTSDQLRKNAEDLAAATLLTKQEVEDASRKMLVYRSITGDTFREALKLAEDMAASGFGAFSEDVEKVGKALNDPLKGLQGLERAFGTLSPVMKANVEDFMRVGDTARAQQAIIAELRNLVGGAGAADGKSLAGAWQNTTEEIGNYFEAWGKYSRSAEFWAGALDTFTAALKRQREAMSPEGELALLQRQQASYAPNPLGDPLDALRAKERADRIEGLQAEIAATKGLTDAEEKLAEKKSELAQADIAAEKQWEKNQALLDKALAAGEIEADQRAQEAKQRADIVDKARVEADAKDRIYQATLAGTDALLETNRELAIEAALRSLGKDATEAQIVQMISYTGAAYDAAEATKAYNKEQDEVARAAEKAQRAVEKTREELRRGAERQAREIERFALDAGTNIVDALWDVSKGAEKPFDSLLSYAEQTFKKMVAAALVNPIIVPVITDFIGGLGGASGGGAGGGGSLSNAASLYGAGANAGIFPGLGAGFANSINTWGVNQLGMQGLTDPLTGQFVGIQGSPSLTGVLGAAGLGFAGGSLLASLTGGNKTGSGVGGAILGAGLETANPYAIAAGAVALLLSSLLGGHPSDKTELNNVYFDNGQITARDLGAGKDSPENRQAVDALTQAIMQFDSALKAGGLTHAGDSLVVGAGSRDGNFRVVYNPDNVQGGAEQFFTDATAAANYVFKQIVANLDEVPAALQDAVDNFDPGNVTDFLQKVQDWSDFNTTMDAIHERIKQLTDPQQYDIDQLDARYDPIREAATKLGEDLTDIETAYGLERAEIAKKYATQAAQSATVGNWLKIVGDLYDKQLAATTTQIDAAEQLRATWADVRDSLAATMDSLRTDADLSPLGLEARKNEALRQFNAAYDKAMNDKDTASFAQLDSLARSYLQADMSFNQGNAQYGADFDAVMARLAQAQQFAGQQTTIEQLQLDALNAILAAVQGQRDAATGANTPAGYGSADIAALNSQAGAAFQASGLSLADWLQTPDARNIWIPARDTLTAGLTDPALLAQRLADARSQKATAGLESIGASFEDSVIAQMQKLGLNVPSYDIGTAFVPRDGLAMLHRGERVVPAAQNQDFERRFESLDRRMEMQNRYLAVIAAGAGHLPDIAANTAASAAAPHDALALAAAAARGLTG